MNNSSKEAILSLISAAGEIQTFFGMVPMFCNLMFIYAGRTLVKYADSGQVQKYDIKKGIILDT